MPDVHHNVDPLALLLEERSLARAQGDPMADLCSFATVDATGAPQVRTLVVRDLEQGLAVFVNQTSPKWQQLEYRARAQVLLYLTTLKVQYRLDVRTAPIPKHIVDQSWHLRPDVPKVMDWLYLQHFPQSTSLEDPPTAAPSARGLYLKPDRVERLELVENAIHHRTGYTLAQGIWSSTPLVP